MSNQPHRVTSGVSVHTDQPHRFKYFHLGRGRGAVTCRRSAKNLPKVGKASIPCPHSQLPHPRGRNPDVGSETVSILRRGAEGKQKLRARGVGIIWAGRMRPMESSEVTPKAGRMALTVPNRTTELGKALLLILRKRQSDAGLEHHPEG